MTALPFVRAALLCERVQSETDGALSAIRILHEGTTVAAGEAARLTLLLMLVRGQMPAGTAHARLEIATPTGEPLSTKDIALTLDGTGAEQCSSLALDVRFEPRAPGVYWFRVWWLAPSSAEPRLLTQVPYTARPRRDDAHAAG